MRVIEVWSGGQTGVDRAALDVARALGLAIGGWVPLGRLSEDGRVPDEYQGLRETTSPEYGQRTSLNVQDSDATLILFRDELAGGSAFTLDEALRLGRPCMGLTLDSPYPGAAVRNVQTWIAGLPGSRLNVAGPRATSDPGIYALARVFLHAVLQPGGSGAAQHPGR